jgi:hypothetical protein
VAASTGDKDANHEGTTRMIQIISYLVVHKNDNPSDPILLLANIDVSRHILAIDTSVLVKNNMDRRE